MVFSGAGVEAGMHVITATVSNFRRGVITEAEEVFRWTEGRRLIYQSSALRSDDLALCAGTRQEMQKLLDLVYDYSWKWRFLFNISKSNVVLVAGKKKHVLVGDYYLGLEKLKIVKAYKYLGLEFEDTLKWNLTRCNWQ